MTNGAASKMRLPSRLWIALAAATGLVLALVVPPLISVNHYKGQITRLMSQSLGRPVRLSSVEARLLPRPGFVLADLSVAEDPVYGAEPVLHANKVTASLRLLALWRGRLEIDKISVDEASLNLVRVGPGQWNLDPIFRTAAAQSGATPTASGNRAPRLPSLEATNSRINFKSGVEKLPFSLVNADISFWQASPGEWRIRLRGQPGRTDVPLYQDETGMVRMEASVHAAPALREMPLRLDLNWREAHLGQLARLITGSDTGWRGDLTGDLHLEGTADSARIAMRLRASGVHRAEFAPVTPLDFDANCALVYHYSERSLENVACDSPLGNGRLRLTGQKNGLGIAPQVTLELDRVPVAAGLDALRTLRQGLDPTLDAAGTVSGKIQYAAVPAPSQPEPGTVKAKQVRKAAAQPAGPLTGSLTVDGFALTGGGLSKPFEAPKITLESSGAPHASTAALTGAVQVSAGANAPLAINLSFSLSGYEVGVRGQASIARFRELAHAAGVPESEALASLAGDALTVDLTAAGPWLPPEENLLVLAAGAEPDSAAGTSPPVTGPSSTAESLTGTVTLRNANWKAGYLANAVQISEATLHLDSGGLRWDPVAFNYGPLKGSAQLSVPLRCPAGLAEPRPCPARFQMQFANLDAGLLQSVLLGVKGKTTLVSSLIDRLHPSAAPPWPVLEGTVKADAFLLGPVTLRNVAANLRVLPAGVEFTTFDAGLLGGSVHVAGSLVKPANDKDTPDYTFEGSFEKVDASSLGALLGLRWSGSALNGSGKVALSGYTAGDLAASAHGTLHFACGRGAIAATSSTKGQTVPAGLARFTDWTGDAGVSNGALTLGQNVVTTAGRKRSVNISVTLALPPQVTFPSLQKAALKP